jgi:L-alanine-DL-glutamate epimerase-like enolase superfamily enzyme
MITIPPGPGHGVELADDLEKKFSVSRRIAKAEA